jgi:CHAT domain-containing protein
LSPDGDLARIPWSALPGARKDQVLLEEFDGGIATVPNGVWLLDQLQHPPAGSPGEGPVLLVGDVFDIPGGFRDPLPLSRDEVDGIRTLAEQSGPGWRVIQLTEGQPTYARVLQELPGCRYAHFACHGFFDAESLGDERKRAEAAVRAWPPSLQRAWQPAGLGARNPLGYTGLMLANAYRATGERDPAGILTGDEVLGLDLGGLRLAVLSACETGLGDPTAAEGMESLDWAFHVSGCPTVVATLWRAREESTLALMKSFYQALWQGGEKGPRAALRAAQLELYHHPPGAGSPL